MKFTSLYGDSSYDERNSIVPQSKANICRVREGEEDGDGRLDALAMELYQFEPVGMAYESGSERTLKRGCRKGR